MVVTINTNKQESGIITHISNNNALFIFISSPKNGENRIRILHQSIDKCIKLNKKYDKDVKDILNSSQLQLSISSIATETGCNHHIIGKQYEIGANQFPLDFKEAMKWYLSGHNLENIHCTFELADIACNYYHDYQTAEKYYKTGIDQGYIYCAYAANVMFRKLANKGIVNAKEKELYYIKKYIEFTNEKEPAVLLDFAVCQLTMDIPDYCQAFKYLQKALQLEKDSIGIQQFFGIMLYRGLGCNKDENKVIEMHKQLAIKYNSECSKLWLTVYDIINMKVIDNIHPLRDCIYDSFINIVKTGDQHGLYYGNWIKIIEYHALNNDNNNDDVMSLCLLISFKLFGFLECIIDIKQVKKFILNSRKIENNDCCLWIKSWRWFFLERYNLLCQLTKMHLGLIELITEIELNIIIIT